MNSIKTICKYLLSIPLLILLVITECPGQEAISGDSAMLFRKTNHIIHSNILDTDFNIMVSLPATYYSKDTLFQVLYSTDADRGFGIISDLVNGLSFPRNYIPDLIVVGIGYPLNGLEDWAAGRHSHLSPSYDSSRSKSWKKNLELMSGRNDLDVRSGQADSFLLFIQKELIPFIENEYRVSKNDRGISGYSLGGLFTIYAMLNAPEIFKYYFAGSPSFWWDEELIFGMEEEFSKNHNNLDAHLYMSVGEYESLSMLEGMKKMEYILKSRNYHDLKLKTKIFPDEIHQTCYPPALSRGLMFLYGKNQK